MSGHVFNFENWLAVFSGGLPKLDMFVQTCTPDGLINRRVFCFPPTVSGQKCNAGAAGGIRYPGTTKPEAWVQSLERVSSAGGPGEIV